MTRLLINDEYDGGVPLKPDRPRYDFNIMKRKMSIAKGFMDIGLLSANANQLRNIINFGDTASTIFYIVVTCIIVSLILQVASGIILLVAEKFDLNDDDECDWGDTLNTLTTVLVFMVLIINVFIASFGVDVANPAMHSTPPSIMSTGTIQDLRPQT